MQPKPKTFAVIFISFLVFTITDSDPADSEWQSWKRKYQINYANSKEEQKRYAIFKKNRDMVRVQNLRRAETGFTVALNQFSDMALEEVEKELLTLQVPRDIQHRAAPIKRPGKNPIQKPPTTPQTNFIYSFVHTTTTRRPKTKKTTTKTTSTSTTTKKFNGVDWRLHGAVTPIKYQTKQCGACWAFAVTGALEGHVKIKTGKLMSLSEQNLVDCARYGNSGCWGGWMNNGLEYVRRSGGLNTDEAYPYTAVQGPCRFDNTSSAKHGAVRGKGYEWVQANSEAALIEALKAGPVMSAVNGYSHSFVHYESGIYSDPNCQTRVNHAILLIGYGTDDDTGKPYWIIKNSWSERWGEKGYMKMSREGAQCGLLNYPSYPLLV